MVQQLIFVLLKILKARKCKYQSVHFLSGLGVFTRVYLCVWLLLCVSCAEVWHIGVCVYNYVCVIVCVPFHAHFLVMYLHCHARAPVMP